MYPVLVENYRRMDACSLKCLEEAVSPMVYSYNNKSFSVLQLSLDFIAMATMQLSSNVLYQEHFMTLLQNATSTNT